jgi:hypothetical protein
MFPFIPRSSYISVTSDSICGYHYAGMLSLVKIISSYNQFNLPLGRDTDSPDLDFPCFSPVPSRKFQDCLQIMAGQLPATSFQYIIDCHLIRHSVAWDTDSIVKQTINKENARQAISHNIPISSWVLVPPSPRYPAELLRSVKRTS